MDWNPPAFAALYMTLARTVNEVKKPHAFEFDHLLNQLATDVRQPSAGI